MASDATLEQRFVAWRDLHHCHRQGWAIDLDFMALWDAFRSDCQREINSGRSQANWLIHLRDYFRSHATGDWHLACQAVDREWPTFEQGRQARRLGIPREAAIHSTLDDGTDTLTPWLQGWDAEQAEGCNLPEIFVSKVLT